MIFNHRDTESTGKRSKKGVRAGPARSRSLLTSAPTICKNCMAHSLLSVFLHQYGLMLVRFAPRPDQYAAEWIRRSSGMKGDREVRNAKFEDRIESNTELRAPTVLSSIQPRVFNVRVSGVEQTLFGRGFGTSLFHSQMLPVRDVRLIRNGLRLRSRPQHLGDAAKVRGI